ncbi:MAG TPA: DUF2269 family protein [Candidatus Limnocylindrales bacterium]|nr:DUF2269 family protein [Candidatus Limnocylindrales bacterium]
MLQLFLFLHVMGAIAVFGPTFAFPVIARHASQAPQHGHFAAVVSDAIERRIVIPGAIVQGITGVALILILGADLTSPAYRWLVAGIILYLIAVLYAVFVQAPAATRMVELTAGGPPAGPPPEGAPAGPPPAIAATAKQLQRGGMILTVLIVLIVILMVTKPGV